MNYTELKNYLEQQYPSALELWKHIVTLESWSSDHRAVATLAAHLDTYFNALGLQTRKYDYPNAGPSLMACTSATKLAPIALMAHMDTVHKPGSFGDKLFKLDDQGILRGPGVHDCKGGLVTAVLVLKALQNLGYSKRQLKFLLVGDEEVAHSECQEQSLDFYVQEGKGAAVAFNFESAMPGEDIVLRRKGGAIIKVQVFGKSAHAGKAPWDGANAILAAAKMIEQLEALTSYATGMFYNCGKINGGTAVNVIPDYCEFEVGLRFPTNEDFAAAYAKVQEIAQSYTTERISAKVTRKATFKAMEETPKTATLFALYQQACEQLGYPRPEGLKVGGCSDAAYMTMQNIPTLCAVGARGDNDHSLQEYAFAHSIVDSAAKITATILALPDDF